MCNYLHYDNVTGCIFEHLYNLHSFAQFCTTVLQRTGVICRGMLIRPANPFPKLNATLQWHHSIPYVAQWKCFTCCCLSSPGPGINSTNSHDQNIFMIFCLIRQKCRTSEIWALFFLCGLKELMLNGILVFWCEWDGVEQDDREQRRPSCKSKFSQRSVDRRRAHGSQVAPIADPKTSCSTLVSSFSQNLSLNFQ